MLAVYVGLTAAILVAGMTCLFLRRLRELEGRLVDPSPVLGFSLEEVEEEVTRIRGVLNHSVDGFWDWDIPNNTETYSPRFFTMLGWNPNADWPSTPDTWQALIHPEDLEKTLRTFDEHAKSQGKYPYWQVVRYKHADGRWIPLLCRGHVVSWDSDGAPLRMVGTHTILERPDARAE